MAESIKKIIMQINRDCDDLDFIGARRFIELNINTLADPQYTRLLNANAKSLLRHVRMDKSNPTASSLTRIERHIINNINQYCSNFDISMLKRTLKDSMELLQREEAQALLNQDARIILENMGAILGVNKSNKKETSQ